MGCAAYLKELLRPLGLYDLDTGPGAAELSALGAAMDSLAAYLAEIEAEALVLTAGEEGLSRYEAVLPYHPASGDTEQRRQAIMALLRIDDGAFTLPAIRDTIRGCGIECLVEESKTPQTVEISFPGLMGEPENFPGVRSRIEQILPCHLDLVYLLRYLIWEELEGYGLTWKLIESKKLTWEGLECYREEGSL